MTEHHNQLGQPIGFPLPDWKAREHPRGARLEGRLCRLEPTDTGAHAKDLFRAYAEDREGRNWTYLPYGPFTDEAEFGGWMSSTCLGDDPCFGANAEPAAGKKLLPLHHFDRELVE